MHKIPCLCINLEHRTDRLEQVKSELAKVSYTFGDTAHRFSACHIPSNPAAGCSLSHLRCLEFAKTRNWPQVFICEDDIQFLDAPLLLRQWELFQSTCEEHTKIWDVVLVGGNNMIPYEVPRDPPALQLCSIQVHHCLTTTGYIVNEHYYETLISNIRSGLQTLLRDKNSITHTIDRYWFSLQERDRWYLLIPPTVVQCEDFSDIEGKVTNFQSYMLNYNKAYK